MFFYICKKWLKKIGFKYHKLILGANEKGKICEDLGVSLFIDNDMIQRRCNTNPYFFDFGRLPVSVPDMNGYVEAWTEYEIPFVTLALPARPWKRSRQSLPARDTVTSRLL